jgi:hypothetical protein
MITSTSSTSPSVLGSTFERGLNSYHPTTSVARQISNRSSLGISRGCTCALETPGTSRAANRSLASPCGTTFASSPRNAIPSPTSSTQTSSAHASLGPLASPSFTSSAAGSCAQPASSWTLPRTTHSARRRSGRSSSIVGPKARPSGRTRMRAPPQGRGKAKRRTGIMPTPTRLRRPTVRASDRETPPTLSSSWKSRALIMASPSSRSSRIANSSSACWISLASARAGNAMRRRPKIRGHGQRTWRLLQASTQHPPPGSLRRQECRPQFPPLVEHTDHLQSGRPPS